jgi:type II secretory pathway predicted ATPase ExeA
MYTSHWGLKESPFYGESAMQFIEHSPPHEEALARLQFLVDNHRRVGLLTGASGSGKTLVLEVFFQRLRRRGLPVAKIGLLGVEPAEMLLLLAAGLKLNPEPGASPVVLWRAITDRLIEHYYQKLETVILLDDADSADDRVLSQVARLARHDASPQARLTLVLAGRGEKITRLGKNILDLAELRIDLEPWDQSDTANFLTDSIFRSGGKSPIFSDTAVSRLYELTQGIPRRAAQLADLALLAGAGANLRQIDADVVESVYHELAAPE